MAIEALCPTCGAVFNLKDEYQGKKVRCKKCEHVFTVGGEAKAEARDDEGVQAKASAAPAKKSARDDDDDEERSSRKVRAAGKRGRDDDDDDERPRKSSSRRGRDDDDDDDDDDKGRKRKRTYHDDDDDDDRPRRAPKRDSGGGTGKVLLIVGGIIFLVLLLCGGGAYGVYRAMEAAEDAADDFAQNAGNPQGGGINVGGGWVGFEKTPKDVGEALTFLRGNDEGERRGAANWLSRQPLEPGRQREVAQALEPLVKSLDDGTCACGARAMRVWGSKDNGPALAAALKQRPDGGIPGDTHKELMAAIGHLKYEGGADEILRFLPNFFVSGDAERALDELGPGAEKAVVKYYHHPDGGVRDKARRLLMRYNTKPAVILDQTVTDLGSIDRGRAGAALEWLSRLDSNEALAAANADPARKAAVATALNRVIDDTQANGDHVNGAAKRWATKDNVPALVRRLEREPWNKQGVGDALIAVGPACEAEVTPLLTHRDVNVVNEAKRILRAVGSADGKFKAILADLQSGDGGRIEQAARQLQTTPVDQNQRAKVVSALLEAVGNPGLGIHDGQLEWAARALTVWATKDDGTAVVDKVKEMNKFFRRQSRAILIEWMGKAKVEKAITFLATSLPDRDDGQNASKALQAMGPDLGPAIEKAVAAVPPGNDRNLLLEEIKILGAVGTKDSLKALESTQKIYRAKNDLQVATACQEAINAINARGK
jgi:predicted Zn finger-like uncharacterized protein